jgi:regulator of sigma E protease
MGIVYALLIFAFLVLVHELGHFLAAKACGVQVNEFAIFMGPAIFKKKIGNTLYSLRCIPFGGYCAMEGEDSDSENPHAFTRAARWKRVIILVAGAAMNFLVGLIIIAVTLGAAESYVEPVISSVEPWSTASEGNGLQAGDTIVEFNGKEIVIFEDFTLATAMLPNGEYPVVVERDGQRVELPSVNMTRQRAQYSDGTEAMLYGLNFTKAETTWESVPGRIWPTAASYVDSVIMSIKMLFNGQAGLGDMSGPVGIVNIMNESAQAAEDAAGAFMNVLSIGGLIAINLAVMNLLPIPALDGGRVVCLLITAVVEKITGKKLDPKYEGWLHTGFLVALLLLMLIITFKDVFALFG